MRSKHVVALRTLAIFPNRGRALINGRISRLRHPMTDCECGVEGKHVVVQRSLVSVEGRKSEMTPWGRVCHVTDPRLWDHTKSAEARRHRCPQIRAIGAQFVVMPKAVVSIYVPPPFSSRIYLIIDIRFDDPANENDRNGRRTRRISAP